MATPSQHIHPRQNNIPVSITLTISAGTTYAAGDWLGSAVGLTNIAYDFSSTIELSSGSIFDLEQRNVSIDVMLFRSPVTLTDNAACSLGFSQLITRTGDIRFAESDYVPMGGGSVATIGMIGQNCRLDTDGRTMHLACRVNQVAGWSGTASVLLDLNFKQV